MAVYPSVYEAKAVSVSGSANAPAVQAYVPQIFGETLIQITDFIGAPPSASGMGWVFFQAGNPEFPVWVVGGGVVIDHNHDVEYVNTTGDTMTGPLVVLTPMAALEAANKGYVDAKDVAARAYTDAKDVAARAYTDASIDASDAVVLHWNSAWGIVKTSTLNFATSVAVTSGSITTPLVYTVLAGRRYRLRLQIRAIGSDTTGSTFTLDLYNNGVLISADNIYTRIYSTWDSRSYEFDFIPVVTQSWSLDWRVSSLIGIAPTLWATGPSYYYLEDQGPAVLAALAPVASGAPVVAEGNALGIVAMGSMLSGIPLAVPTGASTVLTNTLSVYTAIGRRYRIISVVRAVTASSATTFTVYLLDGGVTQQSILGDRYIYIPAPYVASYAEWLIDGDNATHTFQMVANVGVASSAYLDFGEFYVEDVGPNTSPALPLAATPPAWTQVSSFLNGWVNYPGWGAAGYRKIGDIVSVRGLIKDGTINTNAFILPVGFRPPWDHLWGTDTGTGHGRLTIGADGAVLPVSGGTGYFGINFSFSTTA